MSVAESIIKTMPIVSVGPAKRGKQKKISTCAKTGRKLNKNLTLFIQKPPLLKKYRLPLEKKPVLFVNNYLLTASFKALPALKAGTLEAAI